MTTFKIIKSDQEFEQAEKDLLKLQEKETKSQVELDEMELLVHLIEQYRHDDITDKPMPDPVSAIEFRMEQRGLKRKDLRPFLGSASKISEVMNRRIPLSLQMIRALHEGLGIPAEILLQDSTKQLNDSPFLPQDYPFAEMLRRGYLEFSGTLLQAKEMGEELLSQFFSVLPDFTLKTCFRKSSATVLNENSVKAWQCHVIYEAQKEELPLYVPDRIDKEFFHDIASLAQYQYGPQTAGEKLRNAGIHLVYAPHLPGMRVDGAAFMHPDGHPVIAMTLRYDRLDNYWFTLLHELHHVLCDLPKDAKTAYLDDTEVEVGASAEEAEHAADVAAEEALIPSEFWNDRKNQSLLQTTSSAIVRRRAVESGISPAVLAGRIRWETKRYYLFQDLIGKCRSQLMPSESREDHLEKQRR